MPKPLPVPPGMFKVRVLLRGGGMIHLISASEPEVYYDPVAAIVEDIVWDLVEDAGGDTLGFLDLSTVAAVSWRGHQCETK